MRSIVEDVKDLVDQNTAYRAIFKVLLRQMRSCQRLACESCVIPQDVLDRNVPHFTALHMNRAFAYCPFPGDCNNYARCMELHCNADELNNGYAFRRS